MNPPDNIRTCSGLEGFIPYFTQLLAVAIVTLHLSAIVLTKSFLGYVGSGRFL
nr:MAG TPA: hypothetical protein [Caudoviricetes sp.]